MDPEFADHVHALEWTIDTLDPGDVHHIVKGGEVVAVLIHPALYKALTEDAGVF